MSQKINNNQIPEEALRLLPWYATERLTPKEKSFVEDALLKFPELQEQLKLEHEIILFLKEEEECFSLSAIESSSERLTALMNSEEFNTDKAITPQPKYAIISQVERFVRSLMSGNMSKIQYVGFAFVATLSIALLFAFVAPLVNQNNTFYPASTESNETSHTNTTELLIGLNVSPDDPRLAKAFNGLHVKTIAVPEKEGMYRMIFSEKLSPPVLEKLLLDLAADKKLVWFVGEAY